MAAENVGGRRPCRQTPLPLAQGRGALPLDSFDRYTEAKRAEAARSRWSVLREMAWCAFTCLGWVSIAVLAIAAAPVLLSWLGIRS